MENSKKLKIYNLYRHIEPYTYASKYMVFVVSLLVYWKRIKQTAKRLGMFLVALVVALISVLVSDDVGEMI